MITTTSLIIAAIVIIWQINSTKIKSLKSEIDYNNPNRPRTRQEIAKIINQQRKNKPKRKEEPIIFNG